MLVAALTPEAATAQVRAWLGGQAPEALLISDWVATEISSALSLKLRTGALQPAHRAAALAAFHRMVADSLTVVTPTGLHFRNAALFVDREELGLRAADALHLAVAADLGATLVTLDQRLLRAGLALGVPTGSV